MAKPLKNRIINFLHQDDQLSPPDLLSCDLITQLHETKKDLEGAYRRFDFAKDSDAIETCIYEIKALENRYGFLLREIRADLSNSKDKEASKT